MSENSNSEGRRAVNTNETHEKESHETLASIQEEVDEKIKSRASSHASRGS